MKSGGGGPNCSGSIGILACAPIPASVSETLFSPSDHFVTSFRPPPLVVDLLNSYGRSKVDERPRSQRLLEPADRRSALQAGDVRAQFASDASPLKTEN